MLGFFETKYQKMNSFTVTKSLACFDDADLEPDPLSLVPITWEQIKADMQQVLRDTV
jgi:hypothetical protein